MSELTGLVIYSICGLITMIALIYRDKDIKSLESDVLFMRSACGGIAFPVVWYVVGILVCCTFFGKIIDKTIRKNKGDL